MNYAFSLQAPDFGGIRLSVHNLPNIVKIEEPFSFICKVSNLRLVVQCHVLKFFLLKS